MPADLFGEERATATRAPAELNPAQWKHLREWAERSVPWVSRGALGSLTPIESYAEDCLLWFRQKNKRHVDWVATIQTWVRKDEKERLERMARAGSASAKAALRDPVAWRERFDRMAREEKRMERAETVLIAPAGGSSASLGGKR